MPNWFICPTQFKAPSDACTSTSAPARYGEEPGAWDQAPNDLVGQHATSEPQDGVDELIRDEAARHAYDPTEEIGHVVEDGRVRAQRIGVEEEAVPPRRPFAQERKPRLVAEAAAWPERDPENEHEPQERRVDDRPLRADEHANTVESKARRQARGMIDAWARVLAQGVSLQSGA